MDGREGVNSLFIHEDALMWTEAGRNGGGLHGVPLAGGAARQWVGPPDIPSALQMWGGAIGPNGPIWLFLGFQEQWPYSALLCRVTLEDEALRCSTHTPPRSRELSLTDDSVLWVHQYGIGRFEDRQPYGYVGEPIAPTGFWSNENTVWITERATGRLLQYVP